MVNILIGLALLFTSVTVAFGAARRDKMRVVILGLILALVSVVYLYAEILSSTI